MHPVNLGRMHISTANRYVIAACSFDVSVNNGDIQLFPAGEFNAPNGAMLGKGPWFIDGAAARQIMSRAGERKNDIVIDYEHQTLRTATNGQPAPASGWVNPLSLEWREGAGLFAKSPKWTDKAAAAIESDEYRYISPVFLYDAKTGVVLELLHIALTNYAAIDGMEEVGLQAAASSNLYQRTHQQEDISMKKILAALGLKPDATEDEAVAAATALVQTNTDLTTQMADKDEAIAAAAAATPKEAVAAMSAMRNELAELKKDIDADKLDEMVTAALSDGRLVPAQEKWAKKQSVAALSAFLEDAPQIAALAGSQTNDKDLDDKGGSELSETETAVCGMLGVSAEEFQKTKEAQ